MKKIIFYYITLTWIAIAVFSLFHSILMLSFGSVMGGVCATIAFGFLLICYQFTKEVKEWDIC